MNAEDKAEKEGLTRWVRGTMLGELMRNYPADSAHDLACLALVDEVCDDVVEPVRAVLRLPGNLDLAPVLRTFALDAWAERQAVVQPAPTAAQQLLINLAGGLVDFDHPDYRRQAADAAIWLALGYEPVKVGKASNGILVCGRAVVRGWVVLNPHAQVVAAPGRDARWGVVELIGHLADVAANGHDYAAFGYVGGE